MSPAKIFQNTDLWLHPILSWVVISRCGSQNVYHFTVPQVTLLISQVWELLVYKSHLPCNKKTNENDHGIPECRFPYPQQIFGGLWCFKPLEEKPHGWNRRGNSAAFPLLQWLLQFFIKTWSSPKAWLTIQVCLGLIGFRKHGTFNFKTGTKLCTHQKELVALGQSLDETHTSCPWDGSFHCCCY